jgi:antitoxin (DNA-binding transcriptional repressor) of toxin-antitoxin stability system
VKVLAGLAAGAVYCVICLAQAPPALKSIIGEVTSIDAAGKQVQLKGDDGASYTITLADNTSFLRIPPGEKDIKKASKIAFSDVTVGDRALARGPLEEGSKTLPARTVVIMTKGDLAQQQERDQAEWRKRGISGIVTALNAAGKEVTITTRGRDAKTITIDASAAKFRRYAPDSVRFADAKASSFADLQPGDTVRALGDKNEDGTRLKAEELVAGTFETIAATVDSADAGSGEVHLIDLQTKKTVVVRTNRNTLLRRLDPMVATMLARRLRPDSSASGAAAPAGPPNGAPQVAPSGPGGARGPGGPGGGDLQQILERMPQLSLAELKKGDAVIVSSSKGSGDSAVTAFAFVAGVEPFLAAAPRTAGQVNLGSWNLDAGGGPEQ